MPRSTAHPSLRSVSHYTRQTEKDEAVKRRSKACWQIRDASTPTT
jgi:hypothetical protein